MPPSPGCSSGCAPRATSGRRPATRTTAANSLS
jgi:hypothetical protein